VIRDVADPRDPALRGSERIARVRGRWLGILLVSLFLLVGLGMLGGGIYQVVVKETGPRATARITECHRSGGRYRSDVCTGIWVAGGSLLAGGRVVTGTVDGADSGDLGRTIDVRLSGGRAYTTSLRVPIILIAIGLALTVFGARLVLVAMRGVRGSPTPTVD
jgi:hypothetical protein